MRGSFVALAIAGCMSLAPSVAAQQSFRDKVGSWQIASNATGTTPYCYASFQPGPGRKVIVSVTADSDIVLTLWDLQWALPRGEATTIEAAFDDEPSRKLQAKVVLPQVVVVPIVDGPAFAARLSTARRVVVTFERQQIVANLADLPAAYAEARKCMASLSGSSAAQTAVAIQPVGSWLVKANRGGGALTSCTAVPDGPRQPIALGVSRQFRHFVSVTDRRWTMAVGGRLPAIAQIDGVTFATTARVQASGTVSIELDDERAYLTMLRTGRTMTVRIDDIAVEADIGRMAEVATALEQCARREVASEGPRISSGGYTLQQVQTFAIALLRDAGIGGFDIDADAEAFEGAHNIGWDYTGDRGGGSLQLVRNAPNDYLDLRTTTLLDLFRDECSGTYDARVVETTAGPGWHARRLLTFCSAHAAAGLAGVARWIVLRFDNGIGITFGSVRAAKDDDPGEAFAKGGEIDEAIWRSALLRQPPAE